MAAFATTEDLAAFWRPLADTELSQASLFLDYASMIIRRNFVGIDDRITSGELDADTPRFVCVQMVKAALSNPSQDGPTTSFTETAGPFSRQGAYLDPSGALYLTRAQRKLLRPGGPAPQAFTINPTPADAGDNLPPWDRDYPVQESTP